MQDRRGRSFEHPRYDPMVTRRHLLTLVGAGALAGPLRGTPSGPSVRYRDYSRCLPDYLRAQAERAYRLRNSAIAKLTTEGAIRERQRWVTRTFWDLNGGRPQRTPLNARTVGSFEREGYRVEKVIYQSQPNFYISANLYLPTTGQPPLPGVLVQMGHTLDGKASYQRICQWLARFGYVVLGFDPMGQGERTYYPGATPSRSRLGADEEHTRPGRQMLLKGDCSMRMQTWDAVRSLDYLAAHPMVDPRRLASTGQSGGGTNTMLLAAVDDRLAAAAVSCGNTENIACADFNPPGSTDDGEQNIVGGGPVGFDRWDLLYPMAPKPLLVLASDRDFFGTYSPNYISSGTEEFGKLKRIYETLGHADRIAWFGTPLPHGLAYDMRIQIYNWFGRWLKGETKTIEEEPDSTMEPESGLFCAPSGSMVQSFHSETPFLINRKRTAAKSPAPLDALLALERPAKMPAFRLSHASFREAHIEALEFAAAPGVWVPAWLFLPKQADMIKSVVVVLEPSGRTSWHENELYDRLTAAGAAVCAPDLRGIGDLTPEFGRHAARNAREHANDEMWAWSSLVLGRPLAGQRVADLLAVVQGLRARPYLQRKPLVLAARGFPSVPALFAAALEPAIDRLYLAGGLVSFQSIVDTEDYNHPFGNFVPNLLLHTDLPDLAASLAPRRIVLAGAVDGAGREMAPEDVRKRYTGAHVKVLADPLWDPANIMEAA
jgi:dienelactone hydrolase